MGVWKYGDMTFKSKKAKPRRMSLPKWLASDENTGRVWVSKDEEMPSQFLARIVKDLESGNAGVRTNLLAELNKQQRREDP
jgi:hypothetical protein